MYVFQAPRKQNPKEEPPVKMKKDVILDIQGLQSLGGELSDEVSLTTEGRFYKKGSVYYAVYEETAVTGFEGGHTTVKSDGKVVTVIRTGKYPSSLTFEAGQRHLASYNTAYGSIAVTTVTKSLSSELDDDGGRIEAEYDVEIEGSYMSTNRLTINIRQANKTERNQ